MEKSLRSSREAIQNAREDSGNYMNRLPTLGPTQMVSEYVRRSLVLIGVAPTLPLLEKTVEWTVPPLGNVNGMLPYGDDVVLTYFSHYTRGDFEKSHITTL